MSQHTVNCCTGNEILCISIPHAEIVVLGLLQLELQLPCLRITSPLLQTQAQREEFFRQLPEPYRRVLRTLEQMDTSNR